jgi:hypothetical protein
LGVQYMRNRLVGTTSHMKEVLCLDSLSELAMFHMGW